MRRTVEHWGRLDVVVGNARTEIPGTSWVERIDPGTMTSALVGSVTNNLVLAQEAVRTLRRQGGGSVIFIASTAGTAALEEHLAYGVAKAALIHMASILAVQLGPHNVRVNTVSPGVISARGLTPEAWAARRDRRLRGCGGLAVGRVRDGQGLRGRRRDPQGWGADEFIDTAAATAR